MIEFTSNGNGTWNAKRDGKTVAGIVAPPVKGDAFAVESNDDRIVPAMMPTLDKAQKYIERCFKGEEMSEPVAAQPKAKHERKLRVGDPMPVAQEQQIVGAIKENKRKSRDKGADATSASADAVVDKFADALAKIDEPKAQKLAADLKAAKPVASASDALKAIEGKSAEVVNAVVIKAIADAEAAASKRVCSIDGCTNTARKGTAQMCLKHDRERRAAAKNVPCSVALCTAGAVIKGMCGPHYNASSSKRRSDAK